MVDKVRLALSLDFAAHLLSHGNELTKSSTITTHERGIHLKSNESADSFIENNKGIAHACNS